MLISAFHERCSVARAGTARRFLTPPERFVVHAAPQPCSSRRQGSRLLCKSRGQLSHRSVIRSRQPPVEACLAYLDQRLRGSAVKHQALVPHGLSRHGQATGRGHCSSGVQNSAYRQEAGLPLGRCNKSFGRKPAREHTHANHIMKRHHHTSHMSLNTGTRQHADGPQNSTKEGSHSRRLPREPLRGFCNGRAKLSHDMYLNTSKCGSLFFLFTHPPEDFFKKRGKEKKVSYACHAVFTERSIAQPFPPNRHQKPWPGRGSTFAPIFRGRRRLVNWGLAHQIFCRVGYACTLSQKWRFWGAS